MKIDPRTPVIVGIGQVSGATEGCREPIDLMEVAVERAAEDCGRPALLDRVDLSAATRSGTVRYANAAHMIAQRIGRPDARMLQSDFGGHMTQLLVGEVCRRIAAGDADVAVLAGGEMGSLMRGAAVAPPTEHPVSAPAMIGDDIDSWIWHPIEASIGLTLPREYYPLADVAIAWDRGAMLSAHMKDVARLWEGFSTVAAGNPYAVDRTQHSAADILRAGPENRYVGYPYTKLMNSDQFVDQAGAFLICSAEAADAAGIAADRRTYPLATIEAQAGFASERLSLADCPAIGRAGAALREATGLDPAQADFVDLYACFPSAVEIQARGLGLGLDRSLTTTGGMRFAGGPWNSYGLHMLANLAGRLREVPTARALCGGNGGVASRFSFGTYVGRPPERLFGVLPPAIPHENELLPLVSHPTGGAALEAFSVMHDSANRPSHAFVSARLEDGGARAWARFDDADTVAALLATEVPGARIRFTGGEVLYDA
ncbi:acetyl-CoA C-acetyltransferase [Sphingobium sp. OAS761]|uniref:hypothetical protein n=1 Tax=Sphingobium sp. OAS761 TaxID=2817901 RepID=UPI00209CCA54|nr:hypothetical protein [Sphingobium sp. OAS761]MCP1471480.1 acetyl-CoA C-acetyltransferase [Sphingobium sp. OAS761]